MLHSEPETSHPVLTIKLLRDEKPLRSAKTRRSALGQLLV